MEQISKIFIFLRTTHNIHVIFRHITIFYTSKMLYYSLTSSQLFLGIFMQCYFCRFRIYACRTWCTAVNQKELYLVSIIIIFFIWCIIVHIYPFLLCCLFLFIKYFLFNICNTIFINTLSFFLVNLFFVNYFHILLNFQIVCCLFMMGNFWVLNSFILLITISWRIFFLFQISW